MRNLNANLYHGLRDAVLSRPLGVVREDGERFFIDATGKVFDRIDKKVEPLFTMEKGAHPLFDNAMEFAAKAENQASRLAGLAGISFDARNRLLNVAQGVTNNAKVNLVKDAAAGVMLPLGGVSAYYGVTGKLPEWLINLERKEREKKEQERNKK